MISKRKFKRRGSILLSTILAAVVWVFIAQGLFITSTSGFAMLRSSREAMQAQQYAEIAIDKLKNIAYDQLDTYGAHSRTQITGISSTEWQDEVTIGSEADIAGSDGAKQRIATVNVYKKGDTIPRCTLDVPLSSQAGGKGNVGDLYYKYMIKYDLDSTGYVSNLNVSISLDMLLPDNKFATISPLSYNHVVISTISGSYVKPQDEEYRFNGHTFKLLYYGSVWDYRFKGAYFDGQKVQSGFVYREKVK